MCIGVLVYWWCIYVVGDFSQFNRNELNSQLNPTELISLIYFVHW